MPVYQEAFDEYWRTQYLAVLAWRVRPPLQEGFAAFLRASGPRRRLAELLGPDRPTADPDPELLRQAGAVEHAAIGSVLVPEAHERAVVGMTVADAGVAATDPAAVARRLAPPEVQAQIEDQLEPTGIETLTSAVAVALLDAGGEFVCRLGEPYLIEVAGTRFEPWIEIKAIASGEAAPPACVAKCAAAGVAAVPLA